MVTTKSKDIKLYSYTRFSNPSQSLGRSEERQYDSTKAFAKHNNLMLDETLRMTDRGLSGYHGDHRKKGVLGLFLQHVENGHIPFGSILVIENIDRLSREGVESTLREIIFKLWDFGITIQTLTPEESYEPGCSNEPKFMALWLYIMRAFDESKNKSIRIREARKSERKQARESGKILTKRIPAWLEIVDDKIQTIPEAAESIKYIYKMKLEGLGVRQIAKHLNKKSAWMPPKGNGWRASYLNKILQNIAVTGVYQPHSKNSKTLKREPIGEPIADYYPRVISDNIFSRVQELLKKNKGKGGRTGVVSNLFTHVIKCGYCNGSMIFIDKGKPPKGRTYLQCDNGKRGIKCEPNSIRYDEVESLILNSCIEVRPEEILPNPDDQAKLCQTLRERIKDYSVKLKEINSQINNQLANLRNAKAGIMVELYETDIEQLTKESEKIQIENESDIKQLSKEESTRKSFKKWQRNLKTLIAEIKKAENVDLRLQLRLQLREYIEKIEIFASGIKENNPIGIEILTDVFGKNVKNTISKKDWNNRQKEYTQFVEYLSEKSNSKDGRFVRVHFKTADHIIDLFPVESIPYDLTLKINSDGTINFQKTGSSIELLWDNFTQDNRENG